MKVQTTVAQQSYQWLDLSLGILEVGGDVTQLLLCCSLSIERKLRLACHTQFPGADDLEAIAEQSVLFQNLETNFDEPVLFLEQNGTELRF